MHIILVSFLAGILTVLTPCSFTLLPVILSTGLENTKSKKRPYLIILSLALSVILFTLLLKATTALIDIPLQTWNILSGILIIFVALSFLYPDLSSRILKKNPITLKSESVFKNSFESQSTITSILAGISLGPIFTGCSPTYLLIVSVLLPTDFFSGLIYLLAYVFGLSTILILVLFGGRSIVNKFKWAINPQGKFKKLLAIVMIIFGILIISGLYKQIESSLLSADFSRNIINFERGFLQNN